VDAPVRPTAVEDAVAEAVATPPRPRKKAAAKKAPAKKAATAPKAEPGATG
jgi:hypothetical protein